MLETLGARDVSPTRSPAAAFLGAMVRNLSYVTRIPVSSLRHQFEYS